jgi:hypothetical protein
MKLRIARIAFILAFAHTAHAYQVQASNFYRPRPKTLRRIARNFHLAVAIDKIYTNPRFTKEQQELLKSLPIFVRNAFTPASVFQLRNGQRVDIKELQHSLKGLEHTIIAIVSSEPLHENSADFNKVLKAISDFMGALDTLAEQLNMIAQKKAVTK